MAFADEEGHFTGGSFLGSESFVGDVSEELMDESVDRPGRGTLRDRTSRREPTGTYLRRVPGMTTRPSATGTSVELSTIQFTHSPCTRRAGFQPQIHLSNEDLWQNTPCFRLGFFLGKYVLTVSKEYVPFQTMVQQHLV